MVKTFAVHDISEAQARAVVETELLPVIQKLIRRAHKEGSKGRRAAAHYSFEGPLFDAAIRLRDEFEASVRACVGSDSWGVSFGYSINHNAPHTVMIRLK